MATLQTTESMQYGFDRLNFAIGDAKGFLTLPTGGAKAGGPWLWYAPSFITEPYPLPKDLHQWYLRPVLEAGVAVAGVDVGESWGAPCGRTIFTEFHRTLVEHFGLNRRACLLAQSRGGLMHYNWAAENPTSVCCIGGIYPVCDVRRSIRIDTVCQPYGLTPEQLCQNLDEHNPLDRLAPLVDAGVKVLHIHGDSDDVVPVESNSGELIRRYRDLGGDADLIVIKGKGHEEVSEYFQNRRMLEFFLDHANHG